MELFSSLTLIDLRCHFS